MVTGGVTGEAIPGLSKAEKTEVWAQARVLVSRAVVTKHCKLGNLKQFIVSLFWRLQIPKSRCWQGCALPEACRGESFLPACGFHWPSLCSLASSCSTVVSASDVMWPLSPCLNLLS